MKKILFAAIILLVAHQLAFSQDILKGFRNTASLVKKSSRIPSIKNKDGSTIVLSYKEDEGLNVTMGKNGKSFPFAGPFPNGLMVQVAEADIDRDAKPEILVGVRTSPESVEVQIYKKAEFEIQYKLWTSFTGIQSFEFPGDGTVRLYDFQGNFGLFKIMDDGKLNAM